MSQEKHTGRPKGRTKQTTILLEYRTWRIEVDDNFPSNNYVLRKKHDSKYRHVAYCSSLEGALKIMYNVMLIDNVNRQNNYGAKFLDLRKAILKTKQQFDALLSANPKVQKEIKGGENETVNT